MLRLSSLLLILTISSAFAKDPVLVCKSQKVVEDLYEHVKFTAYVKDARTLFKPETSGAFSSDYSSTENLIADKYKEKYPNTVMFFGLEDAWCWFGIILPRNFNKRKKSFRGTIQYTCEDWGYNFNYIKMNCFIKR